MKNPVEIPVFIFRWFSSHNICITFHENRYNVGDILSSYHSKTNKQNKTKKSTFFP